MLTTLDENSVVHLIKSCRFKQTCINWVIAWFSLYYRLWGCIVHAQSPPLPSPTTKGSNISHKHEWRADFTSSQKKCQKCKRGKGFLFIFTVTGQAPFPSARTSDAICGFSVERTNIIMYVHRNNGYSKDTAPPSGKRTEAALGDRYSNATIWSGKVIAGRRVVFSCSY